MTALRAAITAASDAGFRAVGMGGLQRHRVASLLEESSLTQLEIPSFTLYAFLCLSETVLQNTLSRDQASLSQAERDSGIVVTEIICDAATTVRQVLGALKSDKIFVAATVASPSYHLKRRGSGERLCDSDTVLGYDFVQQALKQGQRVELSVVQEFACDSPEPQPEPEPQGAADGDDVEEEDDDKCGIEHKDNDFYDLIWLVGNAGKRGVASRHYGGLSNVPEDGEGVDFDDCWYDEDGEEETDGNSFPFAEDADATYWAAVEKMDSDHMDPLKLLSRHQRSACWHDRDRYARNPRTLTWLLQSVPDWGDSKLVAEAMQLVRARGIRPEPEVAMQLLDRRFWCIVGSTAEHESEPTPVVWAASVPFRRYAVECLGQLGDRALNLYLLQICQLLKHEPLGDAGSGLGIFLLYRALRSPYRIGVALYWHLRSEMHNPLLFSRYGLMLRRFLVHAGEAVVAEIRNQETLVRILRGAVSRAKVRGREGMPKAEQRQALHTDLQSLVDQIPRGLRLPVDPAMQVDKLIVEKCAVFGSAQKPLLLVFANDDRNADPISIIFKDGDDVRQDALCLQNFNLMRQLWMNGGELHAPAAHHGTEHSAGGRQQVGIDIPMSPWGPAYGCVSLGYEVGMLECVGNAETLAAITVWGESTMSRGVNKSTGGGGGVWNHSHLMNWLRAQHDDLEDDASHGVSLFFVDQAYKCEALLCTHHVSHTWYE